MLYGVGGSDIAGGDGVSGRGVVVMVVVVVVVVVLLWLVDLIESNLKKILRKILDRKKTNHGKCAIIPNVDLKQLFPGTFCLC